MDDVKRKIASLDFSELKNKLVTRHGWLQSEANEAEHQYRRYMYLCAKYPERNLPPSEDIDEFWHHHILDTNRYFKDCQSIYGDYKHHYPYFGVDATTNLDDLANAFEETQRLCLQEFSETMPVVRPQHWFRKFLKYYLLKPLFS